MAKEYFVEIGTRRRLLRYTRAERVEIEQRFNCDIKDFVYKLAWPMENGKLTLGGRLEAQEALIYYGVRHIKGKITEETISQELQDYIAGGPPASMYKPLSQAVLGLVASGILGWHPNVVVEVEEEDVAGKDEAAGNVVPITKTG